MNLAALSEAVRASDAWSDRPLDLRDAVKVRVDEGWFLIRPSNTEPLVRVLAEAASPAAARERHSFSPPGGSCRLFVH